MLSCDKMISNLLKNNISEFLINYQLEVFERPLPPTPANKYGMAKLSVKRRCTLIVCPKTMKAFWTIVVFVKYSCNNLPDDYSCQLENVFFFSLFMSTSHVFVSKNLSFKNRNVFGYVFHKTNRWYSTYSVRNSIHLLHFKRVTYIH